MKHNHLFVLALAAVMAFVGVSCEKSPAEEPVTPVLSLAKTADNVAAEATSYDLAVESNCAWTATASEGLSIEPASGEGNGVVTLTFPVNEAYEAVNYTVTLSAEGVEPEVFTLTQSAAEPVVADGQYWLFGTKDDKTRAMMSLGTKTYGYANSEEVVNGASYAENVFTLKLVAGVKDGYTICDVDGQYYYQEAGTTYKTFNVGKDATLAGCVWVISKNEDDTYDIVNNASGKHIRYAEGTYTSFGVYSESEFNGSVAIKLVKAENAKARPVLNLSNDASVADDVTTYSIAVESNLAWTATASEGVTLDKASGQGNATVVMTFAANQTTEAIARTVTFTAEGLTKTFTLTHKAPVTGGAPLTIEFSAASRPCADFPNTSTGVTTTTKYTIGDYEWTFSPSSGNKFSWYSDGYILWGKSGGYILMPAVQGKKLTSVTILTGKNASTSVMVGVYDAAGTAAVAGGTAKKLETKNAVFSWELTGTEVNTHYQLRVTSAHNAQFQKLTLVYE